MATTADELLNALRSYAKGAIKGNTVDTLGAPVDIINEAIIRPIAGARTSDRPIGGSKQLRELFGLAADDANVAETAGTLTSIGGASKAIVAAGMLRKLPLDQLDAIGPYTKTLPEGTLYREMSGSAFSELFSGGYPFGPPKKFFAEVPEMALGQGSNKGLMIEAASQKLQGRPYLNKPGLDLAYLNKAGEFEVSAQPADLLKSISQIWVTPEAFKGLSKGQARMLELQLQDIEKFTGAKVTRTDKLPGR